jgi:hypothetical protein
VELLKSAPRPAFRINLHARKGKKIDLTISIPYKYRMLRKVAVAKSDDCLKNDHGLCSGTIKETVNSFTLTKMCACPCHDSMYHLIRNTIAVVNQNQRNNPYQFTHDNENNI